MQQCVRVLLFDYGYLNENLYLCAAQNNIQDMKHLKLIPLIVSVIGAAFMLSACQSDKKAHDTVDNCLKSQFESVTEIESMQFSVKKAEPLAINDSLCWYSAMDVAIQVAFANQTGWQGGSRVIVEGMKDDARKVVAALDKNKDFGWQVDYVCKFKFNDGTDCIKEMRIILDPSQENVRLLDDKTEPILKYARQFLEENSK